MKKKKPVQTAYAPFKAAKKRAVKRKSAIQRSQDTLIKGRLKFLEDETHKAETKIKPCEHIWKNTPTQDGCIICKKCGAYQGHDSVEDE